MHTILPIQQSPSGASGGGAILHTSDSASGIAADMVTVTGSESVVGSSERANVLASVGEGEPVVVRFVSSDGMGSVVVGSTSEEEKIALKPLLDTLCRGPEWKKSMALFELVLMVGGNVE